MLIEHERNLSITEDTTITVLASSSDKVLSLASWRDQHKIIRHLFERNPYLSVIETMLKPSQSTDDIKFLLKNTTDMRITPEVFEALSKTFCKAQEMVSLLLENDQTAQVPQAVLDSRYDVNLHEAVIFMTAVLERSPHLEISTAPPKRIVCEPYSESDIQQQLAELFLRHEKRVIFTDMIRKAIDKRLGNYPSIRQSLYKPKDTTTDLAEVPAKKDAEAEITRRNY